MNCFLFSYFGYGADLYACYFIPCLCLYFIPPSFVLNYSILNTKFICHLPSSLHSCTKACQGGKFKDLLSYTEHISVFDADLHTPITQCDETNDTHESYSNITSNLLSKIYRFLRQDWCHSTYRHHWTQLNINIWLSTTLFFRMLMGHFCSSMACMAPAAHPPGS
jgi:hypothetical protein